MKTRPPEGIPRRIAEITAAVVLLVAASPLLLIASALILLESGWPIFFGHLRVGQDGRLFRCWKLRTMVPDAERRLSRDPDLRRRYVANGYKVPNGEDPRVTTVGRWLRDTYVDEIPQLFNVLGGSMALVGPRPIVPAELAEWGELADELLRQKPGVTGAWTSRGRLRPAYPERAQLEIDYLRRRSFRSDVAILARTAAVILGAQRVP